MSSKPDLLPTSQNPGASPFRWSKVGSWEDGGRRGAGGSGGPRRRPVRDDDDEEREESGDLSSDDGVEDGDPEERLRDLFRFIDGQRGGGALRQWQRGGNPWGTSTSDRWHQQVQTSLGNEWPLGISLRGLFCTSFLRK